MSALASATPPAFAGRISRMALDLLADLDANQTARWAGAHTLLADVLQFAADAERQLAEASHKLAVFEQSSQDDPVTGLLNRKGLEQAFERATAAAKRHGDIGVCVGLSLSNLDEIAETLGGLAVDSALRAIAAQLFKAVRVGDSAASLGRGRFLLLLDRCAVPAGSRKAATLRSLVETQPVWTPTGPVQARIAAGAVAYNATSTLEGCLAAIERRMFTSSLNGLTH
jgi:diguanylate cyclase (GGDEF)-like protein